jgi:hypothetical protein
MRMTAAEGSGSEPHRSASADPQIANSSFERRSGQCRSMIDMLYSLRENGWSSESIRFVYGGRGTSSHRLCARS